MAIKEGFSSMLGKLRPKFHWYLKVCLIIENILDALSIFSSGSQITFIIFKVMINLDDYLSETRQLKIVKFNFTLINICLTFFPFLPFLSFVVFFDSIINSVSAEIVSAFANC